tara:strand:+ start:122 stop:343 length:222 start_codon:yes stop_codon:yes gene_type:complete
MMKAVGNYALIRMETTETKGGIITSHGNVGKCISCDFEPSIVGKKVMFNGRNSYENDGDILFVPFENIFCVVD